MYMYICICICICKCICICIYVLYMYMYIYIFIKHIHYTFQISRMGYSCQRPCNVFLFRTFPRSSGCARTATCLARTLKRPAAPMGRGQDEVTEVTGCSSWRCTSFIGKHGMARPPRFHGKSCWLIIMKLPCWLMLMVNQLINQTFHRLIG